MARNIPDSLKLVMYDESGHQCAYCGHRDGLDLTVHHIMERQEDGATTYSNLIVLCHNCQHRVHDTGRITSGDLRRIKRHLVHQFFTPIRANAAFAAYKSANRKVVAPAIAVQHLVDLAFFEEVEIEFVWADEDNPEVEMPWMVEYRLTDEGAEIVETWLLRSDDSS